MKRPISWKIEEYIFGACALRDEIRRRKEEHEHHGIWNVVAIWLLMIYAYLVSMMLCVFCLCRQVIEKALLNKNEKA